MRRVHRAGRPRALPRLQELREAKKKLSRELQAAQRSLTKSEQEAPRTRLRASARCAHGGAAQLGVVRVSAETALMQQGSNMLQEVDGGLNEA